MVGARKNLTFSARVFHRYSWGVLHFGINLAIAGEDIRINSMLPAMIGWNREDFLHEFVYGFGKDFVLLCVGKKY